MVDGRHRTAFRGRLVARPDPATQGGTSQSKPVVCLPKGLVDPGEKPLEAALREVREETGITAVSITKLGDSKYAYVRSWSDGEKVFKIVSFYLLRYESGRIDDVSDAMRIESRALGGFRSKTLPNSWPMAVKSTWRAGATIRKNPSGPVTAALDKSPPKRLPLPVHNAKKSSVSSVSSCG